MSESTAPVRGILSRLVQEPLIQFLAIALLIFAAERILNPKVQEQPQRIEVSEARIEQLAGLFVKTWRRPPTETEMKGLIDDFVKEEIAYREALALGLDKDDTVIRRRLRQKLEFLLSADTEQSPTDEELQAYLTKHADRYAVEPEISFEQVYFDPSRRADTIDADIAAALADLKGEGATKASELGDVTMLPPSVDLSRLSLIARDFGDQFAKAIVELETRQWSGPISSSFGLHLVRVNERRPGRLATLAEVRAAVARDLSNEARKRNEAQRYEQLLEKYQVIIARPPPGNPAAPGSL